MDAAEGSPAALRGELAEHRAQLQELAQLAAAGDEEAAAALADVREVIELTEALLAEAEADGEVGGAAADAVGATGTAPQLSVVDAPLQQEGGRAQEQAPAHERPRKRSRWEAAGSTDVASGAAQVAMGTAPYPPPPPPPPPVAVAPVDAAEGPALVGGGFVVGSKVEALFEGRFYAAKIVGSASEAEVLAAGHAAGGAGYVVAFDDFEDELETVAAGQVRVASKGSARRRGYDTGDLTAEQILALEMPKKFLAKDTDDAAMRERKKRNAKAFKASQRFARYEVESNERKAGWQAFQAKGAKKKKAGFFSSSGKKKGAKGLHAAVGAKSAGGFTQQPKLTKHVHKAGHAPREGE